MPAVKRRMDWPSVLAQIPEGTVPDDPARHLPLVMVPPPPLIDPGWPELQKAQAIADAHTKAISNLLNQRCWVFTHGAKTSAHYGLLVKAAEALIAFDIPPALWAGWSCQVWARFGHQFMMPVQWAWSPKRIDSGADWYRSEMGGGARMVLPHGARDLRRDWQQMRKDILVVAQLATNRDQLKNLVVQVVDTAFKGEFDSRLEQVRTECENEQQTIFARVRDGDWLWM